MLQRQPSSVSELVAGARQKVFSLFTLSGENKMWEEQFLEGLSRIPEISGNAMVEPALAKAGVIGAAVESRSEQPLVLNSRQVACKHHQRVSSSTAVNNLVRVRLSKIGLHFHRKGSKVRAMGWQWRFPRRLFTPPGQWCRLLRRRFRRGYLRSRMESRDRMPRVSMRIALVYHARLICFANLRCALAGGAGLRI